MITILLAFTLWAIVHSLTAGSRAKAAFRRQFGERAYQGLYRGLYNLFSLASFLVVLYAIAVAVPDRLLYSVPMPYRLLNFAAQGLGLAGLAYSLYRTGIFEFLGLSQIVRYVQGEPQPERPSTFIASGTYGLVRHPLYFFSMLFLWANPDMTLQSLVLYVLITVYFIVGSLHEEHRLAAEFGDAYLAYKERVPYMVPIKFPGRGAAGSTSGS